MKVRENINFERGLDPKKAMGLGFFKYDVEYGEGGFEEVKDIDEQLARQWTYNNQRILEVQGSTGQDHISMWVLLSDKKEFSVEANLWRDSKFAYLTIPSEDIKDQDVTEEFFKSLQEEFSALQPVLSVYESYFDEKEREEEWRRQIEEEEEEEKELKESIDFERGLDPKDSMGIGNQEYKKNLEVLQLTQNAFPWIEDKPAIYASALTDLGVKMISINQKTSNFFVFHWINSRGGMQLRTIKVPKENWPNLFDVIVKNIRQTEMVKEAQEFQRGIDPKGSMRIGMPTWNTLQRGDLLRVLKSVPLDKDNGISQRFAPVSDLPAGVILEVEELDDASSKEWILWFDYYVNMKDFKSNHGDDVRQRHGYIKGIPKQFKKMFEFLPRGMNEAQEFQRNQDPKSSMSIGKRAQIEKWLKEQNLFEDTVITKDLIINTAKDVQIAIRLKDLGESLPEYIQFGTVFGGFDVQKNQLKTLRGCPKKVLGTNNYKGNFKCNDNQLTSLEGGPTKVDGSYICHTNPGKFTQKEIRKNCKVGLAAWGDEPAGSEELSEGMGFQRTGDPLDIMNLGYEAQIKNWFKACNISNDPLESEPYVDYRINKDGTIDVLEDINLVGAHIENFPYFIRFNRIYGSFYVANNKFTKLDGFPKQVDGDLSIYSDQQGAKKWKESEIRKVVKVSGTIWN